MGGLEAVPYYDPGHQHNEKYQHELEHEHGSKLPQHQPGHDTNYRDQQGFNHVGILSGKDQGYDETFYSADSDYEKHSKHTSIYSS